jgi:hypothetical protein
MVSFDVSAADSVLIGRIVDRAEGLGLLTGWYDRLTCVMDLTATHANGCPMDFQRLLDADDFNFLHDVTGIANCLDRDTGKLTNFFSPRFHTRQAEAA